MWVGFSTTPSASGGGAVVRGISGGLPRSATTGIATVSVRARGGSAAAATGRIGSGVASGQGSPLGGGGSIAGISDFGLRTSAGADPVFGSTGADSDFAPGADSD